MSDGEIKQDGGRPLVKPEYERLIEHIFVLLNHLLRQSDNRLQSHFDDTRLAAVKPLMLATPPCASYAEFQSRLARIEQHGVTAAASGERAIDDLTFLRWSKDFLAAVAAPATVESISITREYTRTRAEQALRSWGEWWRSLRGPTNARRAKAIIRDERFQDTAHWLARQLVWLERWTVAVTVITVLLSAHAMVGRLIIDSEQEALKKFMQLAKSADDDHGALLQTRQSEVKLVDGGQVKARTAQALLSFERADYSCPVHLVDAAAAVSAGRPDAEKIVLSADAGASVERAWALVAKCRGVQWALMQLVTENIRLKSWDDLFVEYFPLNRLIGWDDTMVERVGAVMNDDFCQAVGQSYQERFEDGGRSRGCADLIRLLARDSGSVASSILACITMSILPCLYAFIGAAAASIIAIRRRTDAALLSYTDRGRVKLNVVLGFVFGAVIGLFAGHLSTPADGTVNGLGLSALALLAGYNVPAVSNFLDELSARLFRSQEQNAPKPG